MSDKPPIPAAQYLRMSTEDQQYSIANQELRIREYAERNGFVVVKTYKDPGRSGVMIKRRDGLKALLADAVSGKAGFKAILVYDVSRWGRFQNPDEAAHYEFLCSMAGIPLHYCAEQFNNDGSASSSPLKSLKRSMAAEFSRELGEKVFRGKKTLVELGYWVGGPAGFGYRRLMVSPSGKRKRLLKRGEGKSLKNDRVILVLGPRKEVEAVRMMYSMLADGASYREIGRELQRRKVFLRSSVWHVGSIRNILTNPKYAGCNVWNRHTIRLSQPLKAVAPEFWVQKQLAFPPIVDQMLYDRVQAEIRRREDAHWTAEKIARKVLHLWKTKGRLSETILLRMRGGPSCNTIRRFFGNYPNLYAKIGYKLDASRVLSVEQTKRSALLRRTLVEDLRRLFPNNVELFVSYIGNRSILRIDNTFFVSILFCRRENVGGQCRWTAQVNKLERNYITLVCLMNSRYDRVLHYYILPKTSDWPFRVVRLNSPMLLNGTKLNNLADFYPIVKSFWQFRQRTIQSGPCGHGEG